MSEYSLDQLLLELEWRKCFPDWDASTVDERLDAFVYFCANYWYIVHPERGRILFELREAQIETVRSWLEDRRSITLKARQLGFSTVAGAYAFWCGFGWADRKILILSKGQREARELLRDKIKPGVKKLPQWMKVRGPVMTPTVDRIGFGHESIIEALPAGTDPARGTTVWLVIFDEMAHLEHGDEAWASVEPIADVGGRIIIVSTANGEGNVFARLWHQSQNGTNKFKGIFHPWWAMEGRDDDWYQYQKDSLPAWQLAQEYPSNPEEAFLRSGRPVFDLDLIRTWPIVPPVKQGYLRAFNGMELVQDGGNLSIWEEPTPRSVYVIGADVADGLEHGDFSSAHVIDARMHTVVAHWHGHVPPDLFGEDILNLLGRWYNNALILVERNMQGGNTLNALVRANYPNIYREHKMVTRAQEVTERLGWHTTPTSKPIAINDLEMNFRQGMRVPDAETIQELKTFVREGNAKMHGSPHDDRVMSLAIANQGLKYVWLPQYRPVDAPPPGTMGWRNQQRKKTGKVVRPRIGQTAVRKAS